MATYPNRKIVTELLNDAMRLARKRQAASAIGIGTVEIVLPYYGRTRLTCRRAGRSAYVYSVYIRTTRVIDAVMGEDLRQIIHGKIARNADFAAADPRYWARFDTRPLSP